jgi:hypothetical protein
VKPHLSWFAAALLGTLIGASITGWFFKRTLRVAIPSHLATLESGQEHGCMLSLTVLTRLEAGDTEHAKSILAQDIASFYYTPWQAGSPQRKRILELVDAMKSKSTALRQELGKEPK